MVRGAPVDTTSAAPVTLTLNPEAGAESSGGESSGGESSSIIEGSSSSVNKNDPDGILPTESTNVMDNDLIAGSTNETLPTTGSKCSVGCGVGIGIGCLAGLVLFAFIFIMARRHKRKLHNLWQQRRWLARQKALPDKPMPAPPPPLKH
ncbi:hypothetical protein EV178_003803 [Coemansia sp. RSA 1646]|nr:hypothetical protein EV178_003803 [Coemansia sp. RSA 1646]KAJ1766607.1 hypothetical protein LPJ74_005798 [Coemansia sp. RSA 1843]KAJ2210554.1 hypothetical protein EV179_006158 [Coemansia sp. RSA 487]